MSIEQIFAKERDRYVQFLLETRSKIAARLPQTVGEPLISIDDEAIPYPYRYLRVDVMSSSSDGTLKPFEVKIDLDPDFEPRGFDFGQCIVEVYPFTWNSVQIFVNQEIENIAQMEGWITRWLDVEDNNRPNPLGTSEAIHSFSQVDHHDDWWYLTGDFGTAPADALLEFVELMIGQGMTRIVIKGGDTNV